MEETPFIKSEPALSSLDTLDRLVRSMVDCEEKKEESDVLPTSALSDECYSSVRQEEIHGTTDEANRGSGISEEKSDGKVKILCEIVGAFRTETNGTTTGENMKPYCEVSFAGDIIHTTKTANEAGRCPFWSLSRYSLFVLSATPEQLFQNHVEFSLFEKQKDALNLTTLTRTKIAAGFILGEEIVQQCNEDLVEIDLYQEKPVGNLSLRFRLATPKDIEVVDFLAEKRKKESQSTALNLYQSPSNSPNPFLIVSSRPTAVFTTEVDETQVAGTSFVNAFSSAFSSRTLYDSKTSQTKTKIKPGPDPDRPEETAYMSVDEMKREVMAPSKHWVEAGTGELGYLYLEILGCTNLPNVDVGEAVGNVTDAFICAVFEDTMVQTPVIDDELSPKWMPWTQRAFRIGIMHPASMLYIGCFDFDLGIAGHDALGRVSVNISNLQKNTEYVLKYELFPSSNVTDRKSAGFITIRLRVDYKDEKAALLVALKPRPKFHVNVHKEKSLQVVQYTCYGEHGSTDDQGFDLTVFRSYINEIFGYKRSIGYAMKDSFESLVYWRGQVKVGDLMLPVHSYLFYWGAGYFVERPSAFPALILLGIAWIMLANLVQRQQHPSPWCRCPPFSRFVQTLLQGESVTTIDTIEPFEGDIDAQKYENEWNERIERDLKEAAKRLEEQQQIAKIGDESIHTKMVGIPIDLLERLGRYQGMVARYCEKARFVKIILTWEESVVSFWITFCFLGAGLVALLLPWSFLFTWVGRFIVHCCLGPHMMLVDMYLQNDKRKQKVVDAMVNKFSVQRKQAQLRRQNALKLKDVKSMAFGSLSCVVPNYNLTRHYDRPMAASSAKVCSDQIELSPEIFAPGQQLFGKIIPTLENDHVAHEAMRPELDERLETLKVEIQQLQQNHNADLDKRMKQRGRSSDGLESIGYEVLDGEACPRDVNLEEPTSSSSRSTSPTAVEKDSPALFFENSRKIRDFPVDDRDDDGGVEVVLDMDRDEDGGTFVSDDPSILHFTPSVS